MKKIIVTDAAGDVFEGDSEKEVVGKMRDGDWSAPDRKVEWMEAVQARVEAMTGETVRTDAEGFLEDLEALDLIEIHRRA